MQAREQEPRQDTWVEPIGSKEEHACSIGVHRVLPITEWGNPGQPVEHRCGIRSNGLRAHGTRAREAASTREALPIREHA